MAQAGFCRTCNQNVYLNADGSCVNGHGADCISGAYDIGVPVPAATGPVPPQPAATTPAAYPASASAEPPAKKSKALVITLVILGVLLLCCVVAGGGTWWFASQYASSASKTAEQLSCFANERTVEGGAQTLLAIDEDTDLPSDYAALVDELMAQGLMSKKPQCPSGGAYTWELDADGKPGKVTCSVHGHYSTGTTPSP